LMGELDCYLQRKPLKECDIKNYKRRFIRPLAVVAMEPSMLYFDVTEREYSEEAQEKLKNGDFADLFNDSKSEHYTTIGNWALDLWSQMDPPKNADWIAEAIKNKGWTWSMFRGLSQGLVQWCPESNPQAAFIAQYINERGNFTYVAGSEPDNRFRGHMARLVLEKEFGLRAAFSAGQFAKMGGDTHFRFHEIPKAGHEMYADNLPVTSNLISAGMASDLPELFEWVEEESEGKDVAKKLEELAKDKAAAILYA